MALPARGRLSKRRAQRQKERWFKRALRWRAGSGRTISHLKNPFSMKRASYKGDPGFKRYVGWSVITKNLFSIARWQERRKKRRAELPEMNKDGNCGAPARLNHHEAIAVLALPCGWTRIPPADPTSSR